MPGLKLSDLESLKSYFQAIATSHVSIDGFKFGDRDVVRNDNRSDITPRFLWVQRYDNVRYSGPDDDNLLKNKTARIGYFILPTSGAHADEDNDFEFCESVIEDIIARMIQDKRGSMVDNKWTMLVLDLNTINTGPAEVKIGSTKYIGWEMQVVFGENAKLAYDPAKWT